MEALKINYKNLSCELCEIGRKYDTDKSSQRDYVTNTRHCHPYTLFYDGLFKNKRDEPLNIAELGILDGGSLLMLKDYFKNANIYGFEYSYQLIDNFKKNFDNSRVSLGNIDVTNKQSIINAFSNVSNANNANTLYDIIIDDTTHQFEDQIRVIENTYQYLKPGGILIIEDIFKAYDQQDYIRRLQHVLHNFQDFYFVELDHENRNSTGWDNDKLFILVKGGMNEMNKAMPIFKNPNKITIITPSYRVKNLLEIKKSIDFDYVDEWIIVYDGSKISENPNLFKNQENNKIKEYVHIGNGISGNPQRNYALSKVTNPNTMLYYLDDDNVIHPNLYRLLKIIDNDKMYTFNQFNRLAGNNINVGSIDTAMTIIPFSKCMNIRWLTDIYEADGYYIMSCYHSNEDSHIYVDNDLCYYNKLIDLSFS
jgi:predicted O-methyltransferase YrrM